MKNLKVLSVYLLGLLCSSVNYRRKFLQTFIHRSEIAAASESPTNFNTLPEVLFAVRFRLSHCGVTRPDRFRLRRCVSGSFPPASDHKRTHRPARIERTGRRVKR